MAIRVGVYGRAVDGDVLAHFRISLPQRGKNPIKTILKNITVILELPPKAEQGVFRGHAIWFPSAGAANGIPEAIMLFHKSNRAAPERNVVEVLNEHHSDL